MRLRLPAIILFCAVLLLQGRGLAKGDYPQRIISLGPAITEEIYLLGADNRLVGCTVYCQRSDEAKNKEKIGTVIEVNLEKITALQPDIVLATSLTNPRVKEKLKNLGIKVIEFPAAKNFSGICSSFLKLGRILGKEKEAEEIVKTAENKVDSLKLKLRGLPKPRVFIQVGAKPLVTVTEDSFANDFIEFSGGVNIAQGIRYARYSREKVLEADPEVIFIVTMGINGEKERGIWQSYKALKASRGNRIYILDSYRLCSPTPVSFVETLETIAGLLHPQNE
jgi:iron complex transport system substrate-binding protein